MITMSKDQVVNVHVTGFPKDWSTTQKKEYIHEQTKAEILDVSQYGKKTMFCFKKVDLKIVITSLNGCMIDNEHKIQIQNVSSKSETKNMELAECLHELAAYNWVAPLLDRQQFYLLEKSLRTLYVGNLPQIVTDTDIQEVFNKYGHVEDVSLVLNLETGEHRGFAFVVFQQHEVCDQVFNTAKLLSVNGHLVKIQKSKPSKAVAELAKQAGLYDSEGNVTPLLEQLLQAGKQVIMLQQQDQNGGQYVQDASGQILYVASQQQQSPIITNVNQSLPQTLPALTPTNYGFQKAVVMSCAKKVISNSTQTQQQPSSTQNLSHNSNLLQQQMQSQLLQQVIQQQQIGQRLLVQQQLQQQLQQQQHHQQPQLQAQLGQQMPSNPLLQQQFLNPSLGNNQNFLQQQLLQAQYQQLLAQQQQQQQHLQFPQQQVMQNQNLMNQQQQLYQQSAFFQNANLQNAALQNNSLQNPNHQSLQQNNVPSPGLTQNPTVQNSNLQQQQQNTNNGLQSSGNQQKPSAQPPLNMNQMQPQTQPNNSSVAMNNPNGLPSQLAPALPPAAKQINNLPNQGFMSNNSSNKAANLSVGSRKIRVMKLKFAPY